MIEAGYDYANIIQVDISKMVNQNQKKPLNWTQFVYFCLIPKFSLKMLPVSNSIDEILNRLDELGSLMNIVSNNAKINTDFPNDYIIKLFSNVKVKTDSAITMHKNLPEIYSYGKELDKLYKNIDNMEKFVNVVNENLAKVEQQVSRAEEELGINDTGIKGLFKPFLGKMKKRADSSVDDVVDLHYEPVEIYKTSDYFVEPKSNDGE